MHLTLLVPGLFWPREILRDTTYDLPLPALSLLLGRGRRRPAAPLDRWLAAAFGLTPPLPAAPLRLLGDGGSPGSDCWICLDPVHWRLEERSVVLADPAELELDAKEDQALRQSLAPLLADFGEIRAPARGRWYLRLASDPKLETRDLTTALGQAVDPAAPAGADGPAWRRLLAEAQMQLHAHPVNQAREAEGRPTVNSLWPWGAGRLPTPAAKPATTLLSDDPLLQGLGRQAGLTAGPLPATLPAIATPTLVHLHQLARPVAGHDALAWREVLAGLDAAWLGPALAALGQGRLRQLRLLAGGERHVEVELRRRDLWRFWRRPLPLAELPS